MRSQAGVRADGTPFAIVGGAIQHLVGWRTERLEYVKSDPRAYAVLRARFDSTVRNNFCEYLALEHRSDLEASGMTERQLATLTMGSTPPGYEVHHVVPLDGGGTNGFDNLVLVRTDPDRLILTEHQKAAGRSLWPGQARVVRWPMPPVGTLAWPGRGQGSATP